MSAPHASAIATRSSDREGSNRADPFADPVPKLSETIDEGIPVAVHRIDDWPAIERKKPDATRRKRHPPEESIAMLVLHAEDEIGIPDQRRINAPTAMRGEIPEPRTPNDINRARMCWQPGHREGPGGKRANRREPARKHRLRHRAAADVCRADEQNREAGIRTAWIHQGALESLKLMV